MSGTPFVVRWGIISTGWIAKAFVEDLLLDPKTRGVHDVVHKIVAVGSRSVESAQGFIDTVAGGDKSIKALGSYDALVADNDVDVVYIGTPHTLHYDNTVAAINARKHVLLEKPATSNAAEWADLVRRAKETGVFLMEAMWTRFQPAALAVREIIEKGELGKPVIVDADLSGDFGVENIPTTHRILDPMLGGGAILDLGPYPLFWALHVLYDNPSNGSQPPSRVSGGFVKNARTGVDQNTSFALDFPSIPAQARLSCSINVPAREVGAIVRFRKGTIWVDKPIYCPRGYRVQWFEKEGRDAVVREETVKLTWEGRGMHFEADEVGRCLRDGKLESAAWTHEKTAVAMRVFDEVRRQGGYQLPDGVEKIL
ncbi:hypothetical protein K488DRAFT_91551 [Vararia minispora EC-137]|uniref:Uncharacterized protein n=1 Tax=Vararia minispora EC-137 TaxID=1314806 RepID=A0ACB8Q5H4_9AGAM|nr:hypothetical protein K488DRAFT_91551 [Vararia minispora EC-137]